MCMYSWEGLLDLENEKYVVSVFYLGGLSSSLPPAILEYLSTGDKLQLVSLGPIYLLPQGVTCVASTFHQCQKNGTPGFLIAYPDVGQKGKKVGFENCQK